MVDRLLVRSSLRYLGQHPLHTALTVLGVMIGVAVVVAVDLANTSARRALALSTEMINGTATHYIGGGPSGVPESLYRRLRTEFGLRTSAPLVSGELRAGDRYLTLLGIDFFAHAFSRPVAPPDLRGEPGRRLLLEPDKVALTRRAAAGLGLVAGEKFVVYHGEKPIEVELAYTFAGEHPASHNLLIADIATAQELLGRGGLLDRIDLDLADASTESSLRKWLPEGLSLVEAGDRRQSLAQMTAAFHTNLTAMSLLALLVGGFLIYNTMNFAVIRRHGQFGILRMLGASPGELYRLIVMEAVTIGCVASIAGLVVGTGLGQFLIRLVTVTINDLYYRVHVSEVFVSGTSLAKGLLLGIGTSLLASWLPARVAAESPPISLARRTLPSDRDNALPARLFFGGMLAMAAGIATARFSGNSLLAGFTALALAIVGYSLTIPLLVKVLCRLLDKAASRGGSLLVRLGLRGIDAGISRSGLAVAALTIAVATTLGVGIMISSFRQTVVDWLGQTVQADIYVTVADARARSADDGLPPALIEAIGQHPAVLRVRPARMRMVDSDRGTVRLNALAASPDSGDHFPLVGDDQEGIHRAFAAGDGLLLSEPFAHRQQMDPGDELTLYTPRGPVQLPVLGIFHDYTSGRGLVYLPLQRYRQLWQDDSISSLALYRNPNSSPGALANDIRTLAAGHDPLIRVRANEDIRSTSLQIFDRTFTVTEVLRVLSVIVAFIGILTALLALQLEKARDYALLRATGMTPVGVGGIVLGQTLALGLFAGLFALPLGTLMAVVLIDVINLRSFGWSMERVVPLEAMWQAVVLAVIAATTAGLYPAWSSARLSVAAALRDE